ncbi:MAG: exodeoxyribonuclease VII small subunit, partial [Pirellulaceae bacterium]
MHVSKKSGKTEPSPAAELTFEEALGQLEAVIRDLEDGRLGLNESLVRYE